jgi:hypothetical protein
MPASSRCDLASPRWRDANARDGLGAGYGDGLKHETSETSETKYRNKSYPKHGAVPQEPSGRHVRVEWVYETTTKNTNT